MVMAPGPVDRNLGCFCWSRVFHVEHNGLSAEVNHEHRNIGC